MIDLEIADRIIIDADRLALCVSLIESRDLLALSVPDLGFDYVAERVIDLCSEQIEAIAKDLRDLYREVSTRKECL